jgi:Uma2 family endonuclease
VNLLKLSVPNRQRWTSEEFYRLLELGMFHEQGDRVELVDGEILVMPAQKNVHAFSLDNTHDALELVFDAKFWVRTQMTLDLSPWSVVDPDVAVVPATFRDPTQSNPTTALLVVEVSLTTLPYDQGRKASLYATAGIADYWIVNLVDKQLEVHRSPHPDSTADFGHSYAVVQILKPGDLVTPLAMPGATVPVASLMP